MFDKMKDLFVMQKKMQEVKRQLDSTTFEISSSDGVVKISMNGSQEIQSVAIKDNLTDAEKSRLSAILKDTFNRAIKRSQEVAASKMKDNIGFNIPGLT